MHSPDRLARNYALQFLLLDEFRRRLTDEERRIADHRAAGLNWNQIAAQMNGSPEALRKQLARAIDRAAIIDRETTAANNARIASEWGWERIIGACLQSLPKQ